MNSFVKNFLISLALATVAFCLINFVSGAANMLPHSPAEGIPLLIIFSAVFCGRLLTSETTTEAAAAPVVNSNNETGTVKWFNIKKGYGFITRDQGDDVFVHYRNIQGKGRRTIAEGQRVQFVVIDGDKGLQADEVETI